MGYEYRDKVALVTGASSGIGEAFAWALARRRMQLILVARSEDKLRGLASRLVDAYRVRVEVVAADLADHDALSRLLAEIDRLEMPVDLLINNAGVGCYGPFETIAPECDRRQVMLNIGAVVDLAHAVVPGMLARGGGAIVNVGSVLSFWPRPYDAVYAASKAFVLSFSQALAAEYEQRGLRVVALCPGCTKTGFSQVAGSPAPRARFGSAGDLLVRRPDQVVLTAIKGLESGKAVIVDGRIYRIVVLGQHALPRMLIARLVAARPRAPRLAPAGDGTEIEAGAMGNRPERGE